MDKVEQKYIRLTTKPVLQLLGVLSAPAVTSMLITAVYNAADSYFVSKINDSAVGSVGVIFSFMAILQAVGFMFGHGSGNFISRELGKKNYEESSQIAVTGVVFSFLSGLIIAVAGLLMLDNLAVFLGSTETILPYAKQYLKYILIAAPFQTAALTLNNQLRFQGNAKHGMIGLGFGAILNMCLDPILITTLGLGVSGAGISTMISQIISFCILIFCTYRGGNMPFIIKRFKVNKKYISEIFKGGIPSLGRQMIGSVATIMLNYALKPYGDNAIAAMTVVAKIIQILVSVLIGLGQGFQPVCGINYGAGKYDRVLKAFRYSVISGTVFLTVGSVFIIIFAESFVSMFSSEQATIEIGINALRIQLLPVIFSAYYMIGSMMLQNLGKSLQATVLSISRQGIMYFPLIMILPHFFGLYGAIYAQPVADILSFVFGIPMVLKLVREIKSMQLAKDTKKEDAVG